MISKEKFLQKINTLQAAEEMERIKRAEALVDQVLNTWYENYKLGDPEWIGFKIPEGIRWSDIKSLLKDTGFDFDCEGSQVFVYLNA